MTCSPARSAAVTGLWSAFVSIWRAVRKYGRITSPAALAAAIATSRCCCNIAVLLSEYEQLPTDVRWMYVADEAMDTRLGRGEFDRCLRFWLHDLFNTEVFDLEAMRFVQLVDQGEFNVITLLHDHGRRQPDLGPIEEYVN